MSTITPNMGLVVPDVAVEPGPQWASDLNASLSILDGHNHSHGQGAQIQPNGININTDLSFNQNDAIDLRSVRFFPQTSSIPNAAPDVGCIYVSGNDLYYNDVSGGHQIQITTSGSVNAGAGSITGLPSGTASATYSAGTFVWQSATATAANMDAGSYILRNSGAGSNGLTLQAPNLSGGSTTVTLPAIPSSLSLMALDTSGNMSAPYSIAGGLNASVLTPHSITATQIANSTITGAQIVTNVNLPGTAVQENGSNLVVASTNATTSLAVIRGAVTAPTAAISAGEGFTASRFGLGGYTITFTVPFASTPVVIPGPGIIGTFSGGATYQINALSTTAVNIIIWSIGAGGFADLNFQFIAIGPR